MIQYGSHTTILEAWPGLQQGDEDAQAWLGEQVAMAYPDDWRIPRDAGVLDVGDLRNSVYVKLSVLAREGGACPEIRSLIGYVRLESRNHVRAIRRHQRNSLLGASKVMGRRLARMWTDRENEDVFGTAEFCIEQLSKTLREVMRLRTFERLTAPEIAQLLDIPTPLARRLILKGGPLVKQCMIEQGVKKS